MKKHETNKSEVQPGSKRTGRTIKRKSVTVLHVDDDPNDTTLLQVACAKADVDFEIHNVGDGDQVIDYLAGTGKYADRVRYRLPGLVLLDLKMPKVEGLDVLRWIRSRSNLRDLPVIVLSGSELQDDIRTAYAVGANSYLIKPPSFNLLINLVREIDARLPAPSL